MEKNKKLKEFYLISADCLIDALIVIWREEGIVEAIRYLFSHKKNQK